MIRALSLLAAFAAASALTTSPAFARIAGQETSRDYMTTSFREVDVDGPLSVTISTGTDPSIVAHGDREMIDRLLVKKTGDRLRLSLRRTQADLDRSNKAQGSLRIAISSWDIQSLDLNGPADVSADRIAGQKVDLRVSGPGRLKIGTVEADKLAVAMIGNGSLAIDAGDSDDARVTLNGAPSVEAAGFETQRLDLSVIGPASVHIAARDEAEISSSGSGRIAIGGSPSCDIQSAGMAAIDCGRF